jgi:hypothetical protein
LYDNVDALGICGGRDERQRQQAIEKSSSRGSVRLHVAG